MHALKSWLDRSLFAQGVLVLVLAVGVNALLRRGEHPAIWVIQAALYTAICVGFMAVQRRRIARAAGTDPRGLAELNRKIVHRVVPQDPQEQATMRRLVDEHLGRMERGKRWLPYWLGFMGLVAAGLLVLGVSTGELTLPLVFAVGVIGFCYWMMWMRRRSLERCRYMDSALKSRRTVLS
ncbi:hypothetical protein ACFV0T_18770 [Streptomyces sp. NPDC059582]|uniref:hypothetical protein n=1 Tax=Streptomyces sp. NPDC059582 TaxID=3346875 RepID=UPI00369610CF